MRTISILVVALLLLPGVTALTASINDYDPKPAEAGQFVNVWIKVENIQDSLVEEAFIEIAPKDGLELASGEDAQQRVGILDQFSYAIIEYRLFVKETAVEGENLIEVTLIEGDSTSRQDLSIEIEEKDLKEVVLQVGSIQSDPTRIKPDDKSVRLDVVIQNLGDATARSTVAELTGMPEGITFSESYSNSALLGNIDADGTATATFYIDVDESVQAQEYEAILELDYKYKPYEDEDEYELEHNEIPARISIKPIPLYRITEMFLSPAELTQGDKNVKMTLTIQNIGEETGDSVRVKVYGKSEQPFTYDISSTFVAPSIEPGEKAQGTIEFDIDGDAALQEYLLDVEIRNVVDNDVITYAKKVPVSVTHEARDSPIGIILAIVAVVVLISLIVAGVRRARRKPVAKKLKHKYGKKSME